MILMCGGGGGVERKKKRRLDFARKKKHIQDRDKSYSKLCNKANKQTGSCRGRKTFPGPKASPRPPPAPHMSLTVGIYSPRSILLTGW